MAILSWVLIAGLVVRTAHAALDIIPGATWTAVRGTPLGRDAYWMLTNCIHRPTPGSPFMPTAPVLCTRPLVFNDPYSRQLTQCQRSQRDLLPDRRRQNRRRSLSERELLFIQKSG